MAAFGYNAIQRPETIKQPWNTFEPNVQTWRPIFSNQNHLRVEMYMHATVQGLNVFILNVTTALVCASQIQTNHQKYVEIVFKVWAGGSLAASVPDAIERLVNIKSVF